MHASSADIPQKILGGFVLCLCMGGHVITEKKDTVSCTVPYCLHYLAFNYTDLSFACSVH